MALLVNNADRAAALEITHHLINTCGQNTAATGLTNGLSAAIIHHDAALNLSAKGQPTLAELQAVFTAYEKRTNFLTLQNARDSVLFGATGNNQLNAAIGSRFGSLDFGSHATGTTGRAHATSTGFNLRCNLLHSVHQRCLGMCGRVSRVKTIYIGQNDDQISVHDACNKSRHIIIIANLQLVQRHHVIFVDNGDNTLLQQGHKGVAAIGITMTVNGLSTRNQHLSHNLTIISKKLFVSMHQNALSHSGTGLLAGDSGGLSGQAQAVHTHRDSTTGNKNHFLALVLQITQLPSQAIYLTKITLAIGIGNGASTNLYHNAFSFF